MSGAPGRLQWAVACGGAPSAGTGPQPAFTSHDRVNILNAGGELANVRMTVLYAGRDEVGEYRIGVAARRLRSIRINDLIFPEAVRLDEPYGLLIRSDRPVVVQFTRQDTRQRENAGMITGAWTG